MANTWGTDITILVSSDFNYLPGVYGLFNSAIENGFNGKFIVATEDIRVEKFLIRNDNIELIKYEGFGNDYAINISRLKILDYLKDGNYLFLDADIIFERPCGFLFENISNFLIVSTEIEQKYNLKDILQIRQAKSMKITNDLKEFEYINCGVVGFNLPRDFEILNKWKVYSKELLCSKKTYGVDPNWFFLEQDIWNILIKTYSKQVFSISSRLIEINSSPKHFSKRQFPYTKQADLFPKDQLKYIIHGASLRRPWLKPAVKGLTNFVRRTLHQNGIAGLIKIPTPYERAWAYYTCRENLPIPVSYWAKHHNFSAYKNILWRKAHGIK